MPTNYRLPAKTNQKDFISLFVSEYEKLNPNGKLAAIFSTKITRIT
jgi:SecD/SecF fusion protein